MARQIVDWTPSTNSGYKTLPFRVRVWDERTQSEKPGPFRVEMYHLDEKEQWGGAWFIDTGWQYDDDQLPVSAAHLRLVEGMIKDRVRTRQKEADDDAFRGLSATHDMVQYIARIEDPTRERGFYGEDSIFDADGAEDAGNIVHNSAWHWWPKARGMSHRVLLKRTDGSRNAASFSIHVAEHKPGGTGIRRAELFRIRLARKG